MITWFSCCSAEINEAPLGQTEPEAVLPASYHVRVVMPCPNVGQTLLAAFTMPSHLQSILSEQTCHMSACSCNCKVLQQQNPGTVTPSCSSTSPRHDEPCRADTILRKACKKDIGVCVPPPGNVPSLPSLPSSAPWAPRCLRTGTRLHRLAHQLPDTGPAGIQESHACCVLRCLQVLDYQL